MIPIIGVINHMAAAWWPLVLSITWQSSLLACLLLAVVLVGRRWPSPVRYGLVLVALIKFAIPPIAILPISPFSWLDPGVTLPVAESGSSAASQQPPAPAPAPAAAALPAQLQPVAEQRPTLSGQSWLLLVHLLGTAVALVWVTRQLRVLHRLAAGAEEAGGEQLRRLLGQLSRDLGLRQPPRLLVSAHCPEPAAFGLRQPTVIISERMLREMSPEDLRVVLAHELAHHRRGDLWCNWLQITLAMVWWFNPVFHLLSRAVRATREDCCDDLLLAVGVTSSRGYCNALLHAADVLTGCGSYRPALGFADRLHPLGRRLARIMDSSLPRPLRLSRISLVALLLLAGLLLPGGPVIGSGQADQQGGEEQLLQQQLTALTMVELRRAWPAYALHQVESLPSELVQVEKLEVSGDTLTLAGRAESPTAVAECLATLDAAPLIEPDLRLMRRVQGGPFRFELGLTPTFLQDGENEAAPSPTGAEAPREEIEQRRQRRDAALALLPARQETTDALREIKACLVESGSQLQLFKPSLIRNAGLYDEWPLQLQLGGTAEAIHETVTALSRISAPLIVDELVLEPSPEPEQPWIATLTATLVLRGGDDRSTAAPQPNPGGRSEEQLLLDLDTMQAALGNTP